MAGWGAVPVKRFIEDSRRRSSVGKGEAGGEVRPQGQDRGYGQHTAAVKDGLVAQEHDGRRAGPGHQNPCMDHFPIRY